MLYYATEYLRLSYTNDKTNESDSIANQRKYIDEFVKRNPDISIVNERVDDGYRNIIFRTPCFSWTTVTAASFLTVLRLRQ